jgi:ankyrin repeat protein
MNDRKAHAPPPSLDDISAFCYAARDGDFGILSQLLSIHGDSIINARDETDGCALTWVASSGQQNVILFLLENGADIDGRGTDDKTALIFAVETGRRDVIALLLEKGADTTLKDGNGRTAVDAARDNYYEDVIEKIESSVREKQAEAERALLEKQAEAEQREAEAKRAHLENLQKLKERKPLRPLLKKPPPHKP